MGPGLDPGPEPQGDIIVPKYPAKWLIKRNGQEYPEGASIELTEEEATPLLETGDIGPALPEPEAETDPDTSGKPAKTAKK